MWNLWLGKKGVKFTHAHARFLGCCLVTHRLVLHALDAEFPLGLPVHLLLRLGLLNFLPPLLLVASPFVTSVVVDFLLSVVSLRD